MKKGKQGDKHYQVHEVDLQRIFKHSVSKVVLYGGVTLGLIYISGFFMKGLAKSVNSYKELRDAVKR